MTSRGAHDLPVSLGRYRLLDELGRGDMGIVYRALDPELARVVALKVVHAGVGETTADSEGDASAKPIEYAHQLALVREAKAAATVVHPNIVAIYDAGIEDNAAFVAMEFVQGTDLADWAKSSSRRYREKLHAILEAGRGLQAIHHSGLVHHDIKPQNILIDQEGQVRVADFGLASEAALTSPTDRSKNWASTSANEDSSKSFRKAVNQATRTTTAMPVTQVAQTRNIAAGTPAFMAPEQHFGMRGQPLSDQYAFCVTAFWILCGRYPFQHTDNIRIVTSKVAELFVPWRPGLGCSRRMYRILRKGLSALPENRYPNLDALLADMEAAMQRPVGWSVLALTILAASIALPFVDLAAQTHRLQPELCKDRFDLRQTHWTPEIKISIKERLQAANHSSNFVAWAAILRELDERIQAHEKFRASTCRKLSADEQFDVDDDALRCLDLNTAALKSVLELAATADTPVLTRLHNVIAQIQSPESCVVAQATQNWPPPAAGIAAEVNTVERELQRLSIAAAATWNIEIKNQFISAIERSDELGYTPLQIQVRTMLLYAYLERFQMRDALDLCYESLEISETAGFHEATASILLRLFFIHVYYFNEHEKGADLLRHANAHSQAAGNPPSVVINTLQSQATYDFTNGRSSLAAKGFMKQVEAMLELGYDVPVTLGTALNNAGLSYMHAQDFDRAYVAFERAAEVFQNCCEKSDPSAIRNLINFAALHLKTGQLRTALNILEDASIRFGENEDENNPRQMHLRLIQLEAALDTDQPRQALQYNRDAKNMERLNGDRGENQTQADAILLEYILRQLGEEHSDPVEKSQFIPSILSEVVAQRQANSIRYLWYYTFNSIDVGYFEKVRDTWNGMLRDLERHPYGEISVRLALSLEAHAALARSYALVNQWSRAAPHFEQALALSDELYFDYNDIAAIVERDFAQTLLRMGSIDEAKLRLDRANRQLAQGFSQNHPIFRRSHLIDAEILLQSRAFDRARDALQVLHEQLQDGPSNWPWQDRAELFAQLWYLEQATLGCSRSGTTKHRERAQAEWNRRGEVARFHREYWTQKTLSIASRAACP